MRSSDRASLAIIAICLVIISPLNICGMLLNHMYAHALVEIWMGVVTWGSLFVAGALLLWSVFGNGHNGSAK